MRNKNVPNWLMAVVLILISTLDVYSEDWPQWRGPNRDGKVSGFPVPEQWPDALTEQWRIPVGLGASSPALVDGKLYVFTREGAEEVLRCLNASDGKEVWQYKYQAPAVTGPASSFPGPRSSPTVAEGKVVILGVGGILTCLDAANGKKVWSNDEFSGSVPSFFPAMSPIVVDGIVIAHLGGENNGALIAADLNTGVQKWQWTGDGPAYGSPVLATLSGTQQIVLFTEKNLIGVAVADGKILWQVPAATQNRASNSATPVIDGQTIYCTGQGAGTRAVRVEKQGDSFVTRELWSNPKLGTMFNTPVFKDGLLYCLSERGNLYCLNAVTGEVVWNDAARSDRFGAILDVGSVILVLPATSELIAFKPGTNQYEEVARIKLSDAQIHAHPVIAGNKIYVKDKETLALLTFE